MKTERTKNTQEREQAPAQQQQKHPSVLLMEVQEIVEQQQQTLHTLVSMVSDLTEEVRDLTCLVQTLRAQQANPMVQPYEDEDPEYGEPVDDQEDEDLADEEDFQEDFQDDQEEGDEVISSIQEPDQEPRLRRAAQPAEPTCEGPKPFLLPDVPRARLNVRHQEDTTAEVQA